MDDFMAELDEDVEGMQSTIMMLQQQLRYTQQKCIAGPDLFFTLSVKSLGLQIYCSYIPKQNKKN